MKAHIDAITVMLAPSGYKVYYGDVGEKPTYPYVMLWSGTGRYTTDTLCDARDDLDDLLGVTMVAALPEAVLVMVPVVRGLLDSQRPQVAGRYVHELTIHDSQRITPDLSVTMPDTNRHPAYGVDLYSLKSEPA